MGCAHSYFTAMSLLIKNGIMLSMEPNQREVFTGYLLVDDEGIILEVGQGECSFSAEQVIDAEGQFVAPGFLSAHSHLFTSGSRGLGMDESLYGWIEAMTCYTDNAEAEDIYWATKHGALDFLRNGITTAYDFVSSGQAFDKENAGKGTFSVEGVKPLEYQEAQIRAKVDAGIRFINSLWLTEMESKEATFARFDQLFTFAAQYSDNPLFLKMALSGAVQWASSKHTAYWEAEAMLHFDLINQPHFLETPYSVTEQQAKFEWYREAGALGPNLIFGHFVQTTDAMIQEAAKAGCGMVWLPTSNGRLASGFADIPQCRCCGMRVGVGLDDQSCTDLSDPFQNMRMGIYTQRANKKDPQAMSVYDMLYLHTLGSAETLKIEDKVGSLAAGKYADFLIVDPKHPDTGPIHDPYGSYVLACGLRNLKQVYVGGKLVADDGRIAHQDEMIVSQELHTRIQRIKKRLE